MNTDHDHPDDLADLRETMVADEEAVRLPYCELPEEGHVIPLPEIIVDPTFEDVRKIREQHGYRYFAWTSDGKKDKPLLVDALTANMLCTVHDAGNDHTKEIIKKHVHTSRKVFGKTVDICWSCVK